MVVKMSHKSQNNTEYISFNSNQNFGVIQMFSFNIEVNVRPIGIHLIIRIFDWSNSSEIKVYSSKL